MILSKPILLAVRRIAWSTMNENLGIDGNGGQKYEIFYENIDIDKT